MNRGEIGISTVLAEIRANPGEPFMLEFVRASGKQRGSIKIVHKALYGKPGQAKRPPTRLKKTTLFKDTAQLPITDSENGQFITPLISHIIAYNNYKVKH